MKHKKLLTNIKYMIIILICTYFMTSCGKDELINNANNIDNSIASSNELNQNEDDNKNIISFDTNGGENISDIIVDKGETVEILPSPQKTDFSFVGWYVDPNLDEKFNNDSIITSDITLYAKWELLDTNIYQYEYELDNNSIIINSVIDKEKEELIIPSYVNDFEIEITSDTFNGCVSLSKLAISKNVTTIGYGAFYDCFNLKDVYYDGTINDWCNIKFSNSASNPMYFANNLYLLDTNGKIEYNGKLYSLLTNDLIIDLSIINAYAFYNFNWIKNIEFSNKIKNIGSNAFSRCELLENVYYDGTVNEWCEIIYKNNNSSPFEYAKDLYFKNNNGEIIFNNQKYEKINENIIISDINAIGAYAFYNCEELKHVIISNGVTSIGAGAFNGCKSLESIDIADTVNVIDLDAFNNCINLQYIELPNNIKSIGYDAFNNCDSLNTVYYNGTINDWCKISFDNMNSNPMAFAHNLFLADDNGNIHYNGNKYAYLEGYIDLESVEYIGAYAFYGFNSLIGINIPKGINRIENGTFSNCAALKYVMLPNTITSIGNDAFADCISINHLKLEEGLLSIGNNAFSNCVSLRNIELPNSLTTIGIGAFNNCKSLIEIIIPKGINSIESDTFRECYSLKSVFIPDKVEYIGSSAFEKCNSLVYVKIPEGVRNINNYTFYGCHSLNVIEIPSSVLYVGFDAFTDCYSLQYVFYDGKLENWFDLFTNEGSSLLHYSKKVYFLNEDGNYLYNNKNYEVIIDLIIPEEVNYICPFAFAYCSTIKMVFIHKSILYIGDNAFTNCMNLRNIYYEGSYEEWDNIEKASRTGIRTNYLYFYSEEKPENNGNYWHYVDGIITNWS